MGQLPKHIAFWVVFFLFACGPVRFSTNDEPHTPNPPPPNPPGPTTLTRDVKYSTLVTPPNNKVDILLVIDNSASMLEDNQKLASRLSNFVSGLQTSSINWQMCATVTSTLNVSGDQKWGASVVWSNYVPAAGTSAWVLKSGTPNLSNVFQDTINSIGAGWANTDDERGIKAAWWHFWNGDPRYTGNSGCYRNDAALAIILISDEDERSVGGQQADQFYADEYHLLEDQDLPENLVLQIHDVFGINKLFTVNSIIVKPDDTDCLAAQDASGSKSHFGRKYYELSRSTGGGVGSLCDSDFNSNLNYFKEKIETSIRSFPLECAPYNNAITFKINGVATTAYTLQIEGLKAVFTPALPAGTRLEMNYKCLVN